MKRTEKIPILILIKNIRYLIKAVEMIVGLNGRLKF